MPYFETLNPKNPKVETLGQRETFGFNVRAFGFLGCLCFFRLGL